MLQTKTTLAKKLFLVAGLILFGAVLAPWIYMDYNISETMQEDGKARAVLQLDLLFNMVEQSPKMDLRQLQDKLEHFVDLSKSNVTLISEHGQALEDFVPFETDVKAEGNLSYWPEVQEAMDGKVGTSYRHNYNSKKDVFYAAKFLPGKDGQNVIVRIGVPSSTATTDLKRLERNSIVITAIIFGLAMALAYFLSRHFARSVYMLAETALTIGHGHFDMRISDYPGREFSGLAEAINTMAANITDQMRTISERNRQLQATLDGLWEGVMALDRNGKIQACNQAFRKFADATDADIIGRTPIEVVLDAELQESCQEVLSHPEEYADGPKTIHLQTEYESYLVHITPWNNENEIQGAIVVFNDISRVKRLEQIRQDFLSNITHELRTPLTSIKGYAETLLEGMPEDDPNKRAPEVILKNADHMIRMIEDTLVLTGLESGRQALDISEFDLAEMLEETWRECQPMAEKRGISATFKIDPGPGDNTLIRADRGKLQQVFRNIIENAVKYSQSGGAIEIEVGMDEKEALISIMDNGPGIPYRDRRRVFERFYRVEAHRGRYHESRGTGLGLSISKHIIDMHQGKIWVESPPQNRDQGSVFRVRLNVSGPEN